MVYAYASYASVAATLSKAPSNIEHSEIDQEVTRACEGGLGQKKICMHTKTQSKMCLF
jgi:hypothetical protein